LSAPVLPPYIKGKGAAAPVAPVVQTPLPPQSKLMDPPPACTSIEMIKVMISQLLLKIFVE